MAVEPLDPLSRFDSCKFLVFAIMSAQMVGIPPAATNDYVCQCVCVFLLSES